MDDILIISGMHNKDVSCNLYCFLSIYYISIIEISRLCCVQRERESVCGSICVCVCECVAE